jgi:hypothetical protein
MGTKRGARHRARGRALRPRRSPHAARAGRLALALGALVGGYLLLVDLSRHAVVANSDSATVALEGRSIIHGNLLLSGWRLSLDSFWTLDAVANAIGVALVGLRGDLVNLVPAGIALALVVLGARIATEGCQFEERTVAVLMIGAVLLAPSHALSYFLLQGPWHLDTALYCLAAFWLLRRGEFGWRWALGAAVLGAGLLGDLQMLSFGVIPVALDGVVAALRERRIRAGLATCGAALSAVLGAVVVREVALAIGTFTYNESHHTASGARMVTSAGHLLDWGGALFGLSDGPYGGPSVPVVSLVAHGAILLVVLGALAISLAGTLRQVALGSPRGDGASETAASTQLLDELLLFALFGVVATFELLTLSNKPDYARYLTAGVVFAVVLAARVVARRLGGARRRTRRGAVVASALVFALCALEIPAELHAPLPAQSVDKLVQLLEAHHLDHGIGDYWAASVVGVESAGQVLVRPVVANLSHRIVPYGRQSEASWYTGQHFQFLVYQRAPYGRVDAATVAGTFGRPSEVLQVEDYYVALFGHPLTLSGASFP